MAIYSIADLSRREILRMSARWPQRAWPRPVANAQSAERRTPEQAVRSLRSAQGLLDQNADPTRVPGRLGAPKVRSSTSIGRCQSAKAGLS